MQLFTANRGTGKTIMHGRVIYILAIVTLAQTAYPLSIGDSPLRQLLWGVVYLFEIVAGILVVRESPRDFYALIALGVVWIFGIVGYVFFPDSQLTGYGAYIAIGLYQAWVAVVLLRYIFRVKGVDRDVLYAACTVYLLIGAVFVAIYGTIEISTFYATGGLHAFSDSLVPDGTIFPWQTFVYYSYATLTTLGYGDILPLTPWARSAASVEAIIGVLYITIIMARLVGLYAVTEVEEDIG